MTENLVNRTLSRIERECKLSASLQPHSTSELLKVGDERKSAAMRLLEIARSVFTMHQDQDGAPFLLRRDGLRIALPLRGGRHSVRAELARLFFERENRVASNAALADALGVIEGHCQQQQPCELHLRVARRDDAILVDLGDKSGRIVRIDAAGWRIEDSSPILFRRTELTSAMPAPEQDGVLGELKSLVNISPEDWPLLKAWLVAALMPDIPHPIAFIAAQQGAGKTTLMKMLLQLMDPSPVPIRSCPKDAETWAVQASAGWAIGIDNVSGLPAWFSDALCRAVSGDGYLRRRLYSDSNVSVLAFRRVIALTTIDAGALRGDLGERLLVIELPPIGSGKRRSEAEILAAFEKMRPRLLGGLFTLVSRALAALPNVKPRSWPRMADFAMIVAALDDANGTRALERFTEQASRVAADVVDSSPVASAVRDFMGGNQAEWEGNASALLERLAPIDSKPPRGWPRSARGLSGELRRVAPALSACGVHVVTPDQQSASEKSRKRVFTLRRLEERREEACEPSDSAKSSLQATEGGQHRTDARGSGPSEARDRIRQKPHSDAVVVGGARSNGWNGSMQSFSEDEPEFVIVGEVP